MAIFKIKSMTTQEENLLYNKEFAGGDKCSPYSYCL